MTQHTPGPWILNGLAIETEEDDEGRSVCLAHVYDPDDNGPDEYAANARLMAASPEMFDALVAFTDELPLNVMDFYAWFAERSTRARAAIAKARGTKGE